VRDDGEAEDDADGEEWVSTWGKPTDDRLQAIVDFMVKDGRANYTRQQIEIGAGYGHPDHTLDPDTYKKMSRRLQRDLQLLIEDGDIVCIIKDNPQHKGGFKNKIYLYALAPDKEDATEKIVSSPEQLRLKLKEHLTSAFDALDAFDLVELRKYLSTALDALDANDADNC
jgi:hypothetical protein